MYTVELFAVATKPYGVVAPKNLLDAIFQTILGNFQIAQDAIASEDELKRPDFRPDFIELAR